MRRARIPFALTVLVGLAAACQRPEPAPATDTVGPTAVVFDAGGLRQAAVGRDPEAMDESLRAALQQFRDRFACNAISGCPAEAVLLGHGWAARPYLEQVYRTAGAQAPYRARSVRVLAELRDPTALPLLLEALSDRDPEVRAYGAYGLGLLDARDHARKVAAVAREPDDVWAATARLGALWTLHRWGNAQATGLYLEALRRLTTRQMGGQALAWGIELCQKPGAPDCSGVLPLASRHPTFVARRAAARAMAAAPVPAYAAALVELTGDPVQSIARLAESALAQLSGQARLQGHAAWQKWCAETGCATAAPGAPSGAATSTNAP